MIHEGVGRIGAKHPHAKALSASHTYEGTPMFPLESSFSLEERFDIQVSRATLLHVSKAIWIDSAVLYSCVREYHALYSSTPLCSIETHN